MNDELIDDTFDPVYELALLDQAALEFEEEITDADYRNMAIGVM